MDTISSVKIEIDLVVLWSHLSEILYLSERNDLVPESLDMICIEVRRPHRDLI